MGRFGSKLRMSVDCTDWKGMPFLVNAVFYLKIFSV
jgi:hypothetical protein